MPNRVRTCECGRTYVLRKHYRTRKLEPITTYPVERGTVDVLDDGTFRVIGRSESFVGPRYINHGLDCPLRATPPPLPSRAARTYHRQKLSQQLPPERPSVPDER
jgi:hypothetical protein